MSKRIYNSKVVLDRYLLISCCVILPIAPFIIIYLIINKTKYFEGIITNKRSVNSYVSPHGLYAILFGNSTYYLTVGEKELLVSKKIYEMFVKGDKIFVAHRGDALYYCAKTGRAPGHR